MQATKYVKRLKEKQGSDTTSCREIAEEPLFDEVVSENVLEHENVSEEVTVETAGPQKLIGIVELILKQRPTLDRLIRDPSRQRELMTRFLAISLIGFTFFGIAMVLVLTTTSVWPQLASIDSVLQNGGRLIEFDAIEGSLFSVQIASDSGTLILAYSLGLIAATGICLPSLYFYGLLSGIRMSMLDVTIHALKAKATSAIALIGILPIYAAICMGIAIFHAPEPLIRGALWLGLILPFIAGLWGTRSLYVGFSGLCDTMPAEHRHKRACFLRRLVVSWGACYTAISPVMIYTLWQHLA